MSLISVFRHFCSDTMKNTKTREKMWWKGLPFLLLIHEYIVIGSQQLDPNYKEIISKIKINTK